MNTAAVADRLAQRGLTPRAVADLVGIHPERLADTAPSPALARRVLAALAHADRPWGPEQLADILACETADTEAALEVLATDREATVPYAVRRVGARAFRLTPRVDLLSRAEQDRLRVASHEQGQLSTEQGRALWRVATGKEVPPGDAGLLALQEAGLVSEEEPWQLCEDLAFALDPSTGLTDGDGDQGGSVEH